MSASRRRSSTTVSKPEACAEDGWRSEAEFHHAIDLVKQADVAVLVLGEAQTMSGERASRSTLTLPGKQQQLLEAAVATGKPVVLVLINGRPLDITWASEHVSAILDAWYPGTEGGNAIADLAVWRCGPRRQAAGDVAASGRSGADSLWANLTQIPNDCGHDVLGRIERAAVSVWLWAELYDVLGGRAEGKRGEGGSGLGRSTVSMDVAEHGQGRGR